MSGVLDVGSIRSVLSGPGVRRTFASALVGRLAYGVLPLCFLFTVRDATGSFAVAASSSAALGLATLAMPVQARLVDRHGQRRVLPCYAAAHVALLLAAAGLSGGAPPDLLWVALGALLGLAAPALGPAMRAQWREIAAEGAPRRVAYSLDSVGEESLYLVGPLVAGLVLATGPAAAGLVLAAAFVAAGTAALVLSPYVPVNAGMSVPTPGPAPGTTPGPPRPGPGVLRVPVLRRLLLAMLLLGSSGAACFVGVAALADLAGTPGAVGPVEAAMAVGAILAGLVWTRLPREPSWTAALPVLLLLSAAAQGGAALAAPHLVAVAACLVVVGAVAAPVLVVAFTAADTLVPPARRTEASTWVSTSLNAGNAAGTALAGLLAGLPSGLGAASGAAPFVLGVGATLVAVVAIPRSRPGRPR